MGRVLTSRQCRLAVSWFTRHEYPDENAVPLAIIYLMASFLNLWQYFRFTEEQLEKLRTISSRGDIRFIPIQDVRVLNRDFKLQIIARARPVRDRNKIIGYGVYLELDCDRYTDDQLDVEMIAGYFGIQPGKFEAGWVHFDRNFRLNDCPIFFQPGFDELTGYIPLSHCRSLDLCHFSIYFDVQQITFYKDSGIENISNPLPPLKGYGRHKWIIEDKELFVFQLCGTTRMNMEEGWCLLLQYRAGSIQMNLHHPFLPADVDGYDVKITGMSIVKNRRNDTKYHLRAKSGAARRTEFEHILTFPPFRDQESYTTNWRTLKIGFNYKHLCMASSITLEVQWEIIKLFEEDSNGEWVELDKSSWIRGQKGIDMTKSKIN